MAPFPCKLEEVENEIFNSGEVVETIQPESSDKHEELMKRVTDVVYPEFFEIYGGETRTMERFLMARDWDVKKAEKMLRKCVEYRQEKNLDGKKSKDELQYLEDIEKEIRPHWAVMFWGLSKDGNLMTYASVKNVVLKDILKIPEENIKRFFLEELRKASKIHNYANSEPRKSSDQKRWRSSIDIIDLKGISMAHLHISGLRVLNRVLKLAQIVAPEIMDKTYIINSPWFFSAAWSVIKKVLAPQIVAKVTITSGSAEDEILEHLGGDREAYEDLISSGN
mmetsp:Transcript_4915/g.6016  ORF Transcript_4915/g.6016 Transcript_4915/m.6016 type:complete len:280 (+) Transcript_4915:123-962(+)